MECPLFWAYGDFKRDWWFSRGNSWSFEYWWKIQLIFNFIPAQREAVIKKKIQTLLSHLPKSARGKVKIRNGLPKEELRAFSCKCSSSSCSVAFRRIWFCSYGNLSDRNFAYYYSCSFASRGCLRGSKVYSSYDQKALVQAGLELYKGEISQLPKSILVEIEQYQTLSRWYQEE